MDSRDGEMPPIRRGGAAARQSRAGARPDGRSAAARARRSSLQGRTCLYHEKSPASCECRASL